MPTAFMPAASLGWNTRDPVTAMRPGFAPIFDNYTIEKGVPRVRWGWRVWASGLPGRVDGLLPWNGTTNRLFASSGTVIHEVTSGGPVGAAVVTGLTNARWSSIQFSASGGQFLFAFNGADTPRTFDGTTWANWTGTGVTGGVAWAGASNGRLYVGNPSRLSFFYGAAGAIGGTFTEFPLQGVAQRGGGVVAMTTLSGDGGAGPQTLTVFLTSNEEAIVYAGTDPASATTWTLVGRWRIPRLLGAPHRCVAGYGGDALAVTAGGLLPLSALRSGADAQTVQERAGLTRRIAPTWRELADTRGALAGWGVTPLAGRALVVVNAPWTATAAQQIVVSEGGAVSRWGGIPAAVWDEALGGRVFCGDAATGRVLIWGEDAADGGLGVRSEGLLAYSALGAVGRVKRGQLVQVVLNDALAIQGAPRVLADWSLPTPQMDNLGPTATAPALPTLMGGGTMLVWGVGQWGVNLWGNSPGFVSRAWRTGSATGHAMTVQLQMVSGQSRPGWIGTNLVWENGGPVR
jgi:hypothetical protein